MFIVRNRKVFYSLSIILIAVSLAALFVWGLKPGIDLRGGSIIEVEYAASSTPDVMVVRAALDKLALGEYSVRPTGAAGLLVRTEELDQTNHDKVLAALSANGVNKLEEKRFNSVGPVLGEEALQKSWISIIIVLLCIVLFITFAFRRVSRPVSSWKYGIIAIIGLAHNIVITAGAFAIFGHYFGFEIDTLFVTALLVILGFSIHDTIVVFDRIRENLGHANSVDKQGFETIVGESINQTFVRSINTSLTTLVSVAALYVFGPESTKHFSLALMIGIAAGTYSSIFLCSPMLVTVNKKKAK
jgi:preprotein translocase subunit SecF